MTRLFAAFALLVLLAGGAGAQPVQPYGVTQCNQSAFYDGSASGSSQLVAAASAGGVGERIYVCSYVINVGATATNVSLQYGTGSNCGTGTTALTPVWIIGVNGQLVDPGAGLLVAPPGSALCVLTSAANPVKVLVRYLQVPGA